VPPWFPTRRQSGIEGGLHAPRRASGCEIRLAAAFRDECLLFSVLTFSALFIRT
jgi:hypothetical protein